MIDWNYIDHLLLDMDGTLLDLHFDNHFWLEHLPQRYATHKNLPLEIAHAQLMGLYRQVEGTLAWYSVDYWAEQLGLDILSLQYEVAHLISEHTNVLPFLHAMQRTQVQTMLVTNAHRKTLQVKFEFSRLGQYVEKIVCSHDVGRPKEDPAFWAELQTIAPYNPSRTLLVDDNLNVLRAAQTYGIAHLLCIATPDTRRPPRQGGDFTYLRDFADITPA